MGRICPLQLQVNFTSGLYVNIPTTTHFFQWANRTHSNFKMLIYIGISIPFCFTFCLKQAHLLLRVAIPLVMFWRLLCILLFLLYVCCPVFLVYSWWLCHIVDIHSLFLICIWRCTGFLGSFCLLPISFLLLFLNIDI